MVVHTFDVHKRCGFLHGQKPALERGHQRIDCALTCSKSNRNQSLTGMLRGVVGM
jgi:hypothetical protein